MSSPYDYSDEDTEYQCLTNAEINEGRLAEQQLWAGAGQPHVQVNIFRGDMATSSSAGPTTPTHHHTHKHDGRAPRKPDTRSERHGNMARNHRFVTYEDSPYREPAKKKSRTSKKSAYGPFGPLAATKFAVDGKELRDVPGKQEELCVCCLANKRQYASLNCGHVFGCYLCGRKLLYGDTWNAPEDERVIKPEVKCPLCNIPITYALFQVYI